MPIHRRIGLIGSVYATLKGKAAGGSTSRQSEELVPAVPVKKSLTPNYLVCLEDGKRFKSLKRHLSSRHNLTPDQYREKWGLAGDYPMVAPNYSDARSELAKTMGLGRASEETARPESSSGKSQSY